MEKSAYANSTRSKRAIEIAWALQFTRHVQNSETSVEKGSLEMLNKLSEMYAASLNRPKHAFDKALLSTLAAVVCEELDSKKYWESYFLGIDEPKVKSMELLLKRLYSDEALKEINVGKDGKESMISIPRIKAIKTSALAKLLVEANEEAESQQSMLRTG